MYRGISDFKKGYEPRTDIVKDEKGCVVTDFHRTLARLKNHFDQLLKVRGVKDVRQTAIHCIKMDLQEVEWRGMDCVALAQDKDCWRALVNLLVP